MTLSGYLYKHANRFTALLKYILLVTHSFLKFFSTPFNMDSIWSQRKHVMLHCFKKDNSENDTKNEICDAYNM